MRKRLYAAALAMSLSMLLTSGCGDKKEAGGSVDGTETASTGTFDFDAGKYVTLGEYKGLTVQYPVPTVPDDGVEMEIEYLLNNNTEYKEISDRAIQNGDYVNIDFTGTINGEEFDGGSNEGYAFTLGEGEFLEEFEKNLIGKKAKENVTFRITYPEDYDEELGGKEAEFSVTVNSVSEVIVPEYNDAFIAEVTDYASIKEFEEATMEELMLNAQEESESNAGSDALQKAVDQASIDGYPQALYDACYNSTIEEYQEYAEMFDMDLSEFMGDEDEMEAEVLNWVNEILVSQAIAEKEGFTVTDENFNDDAEELALDYGYDSLEEFTEDYGETYVRLNLIKERAIDFLYEHADLQEVSGEEYYGEDEDLEGALDTEILFEEDME